MHVDFQNFKPVPDTCPRYRVSTPRRINAPQIASSTRQPTNHLRPLRPSCTKLRPPPLVIILKLKPRTNRTSHQRPVPTLHQPRPLPNPTPHHHLRPLPRSQITPDHHAPPTPISEQLQHLHRIARIKMKHLIALQPMHLAKRPRLQQVINRRPSPPRPVIPTILKSLRCHHLPSLITPHIPPTLTRMRPQPQQILHFLSSHPVPLKLSCTQSTHSISDYL
jgi:hypothetical protein